MSNNNLKNYTPYGWKVKRQTAIGECLITTAEMSDDLFLRDMAKRFKHSIGFLPDAGRRIRISNGEVKLVCVDDLEIGFFIHSRGMRKVSTLSQIALREDAWRNGIGEFCIETLLLKQLDAVHPGLRGRIRNDLDMNKVAISSGGLLVNTEYPNTTRKIPINEYRWNLGAPLVENQLLFDFGGHGEVA